MSRYVSLQLVVLSINDGVKVFSNGKSFGTATFMERRIKVTALPNF